MLLSSIKRSVNRIPTYLMGVSGKKMKFISGKAAGKRCMDSIGCLKTRCEVWYSHTRTFCTTVESESESNEVDKNYGNLITSTEVEKKIKMILLECELAKQIGLRAPSTISEKDMKELLELRSIHARQKYFHYLRTKELTILAAEKKKQKKQLEYQMKLEEKNKDNELSGHLRYGLYSNSMFMYIRRGSINAFYVSRLCCAAVFEQPLVFDLDFDDEMSPREIKNTAKQLQDSYGQNRICSEPFDICFCNLRPESKLTPYLKRFIQHIDAGNSMITVEKRSYLDLFPKEKLVYLSPNASDYLTDYESDKIYIIGGIVDKQNEKPLTLAKAKREGIKTAKFPLDKYLLWGHGAKNLTINQVVMILLEWKKTNDWNKALRFVPTRKLKRAEDHVNEQEKRIEKLKKYKGKSFEPMQNKNPIRKKRIVQGLFE